MVLCSAVLISRAQQKRINYRSTEKANTDVDKEMGQVELCHGHFRSNDVQLRELTRGGPDSPAEQLWWT